MADVTAPGSSEIGWNLPGACRLGGGVQGLRHCDLWELESLRWRRQDDGLGEYDYPH